MANGRMTPGRVIIVLAVVALISGVFPAAAAPKTITFWHYWKSSEGKALQDIVDRFNQTHKDLQIKTLSTADYDNHHNKLLTSITGGTPPDVSVVSSDYLPEWVYNGALLPLDSYIKGSKFNLADFYSVTVKLGQVGGKTYALSLNQDTYALLWNKDLFKKAGLDPEKPPRTIADLDKMAEKLTVKDAKGKLIQIGFIPDFPWGHFPMYAWAFGGSFYDPKTNKITANDPKNIRALAWEQSYYKKYGLKDLNAFKSGLGEYQTAGYAFYTGQVAMVVEGEWQPAFIPQYAPKNFAWGAAPFPGEKDTPALYGQTVTSATMFTIPKGSKHPKEAWEFIQWMEKPENAGAFDAAISNVPPFKSLGGNKDYVKDARFGVFMQLLNNQYLHLWPQIPVASVYMNQLGTAEEHVLVAGDKDPKTALDELAKNIQAELNKAK